MGKMIFTFGVLVAVFGVSKSQAPIPDRIPGWSYDPHGNGFEDNAIEVEVFVDLQCPDCKMAWDTLKQMANHYGRQVCKKYNLGKKCKYS